LKSYYELDNFGIKQVVKAVDDVSIELHENEIYGIAGESGCGKTTIIKTIFGMIEPPLRVIEGKVLYKFNGKLIDIFCLSEEDRRKLKWEYVSYIPQGSMNVLNPVAKIIDSFWDFIKAHKTNINRKEIEASIAEYLDALGLPSKILIAYPHQLSGGMRQRVTIALATILKPRVIIADEPSTALDVIAQRSVIQLLKDIQTSQKNTIIMVTHDMAVHANIAKRMAIMYAGKIVEEGKVEDIFNDAKHPYSAYMIKSLPKVGDKSYKLSAPGLPPSLVNPPKGCRFHPRCELVMERCKVDVPKLVNVKNGHRVACFSYSEEAEHDENK
jgi:peptide/nickel transport system ATP-binding protein